ncbi:DciA family protein [Crenothrix polyspora]|uniref:DUF721 domain-containing protein n=1 Tax=Crenothrix polyspora TaxID=360316 RepID=A0A1R4H802_9GAMM|nr:DciA family protein [Crenothrix polyspora]SJM92373.1 conserved hypothetical protein [Crenothrix polyspora]
MSTFKSITHLHSRTLNQLHYKINAQRQLTQQIKAVLPTILAKQVAHCVINDKTLLLYSYSANAASQLRFYNASIIAAAGAIATVQIKIMVKPGLADTVIRKATLPSIEKIELLRSYSDRAQDDQLKTALLKLSDTLTRLSGKSAL